MKTFSREKVSEVFDELMPLFQKHYKEIAHYQDIDLDPDKDLYVKLCEAGAIRVYTARDFSPEGDGKLVGYAVYFIKHNIHYKKSLQAVQDVLFIDPSVRGFGMNFIKWCDEQLKVEGVQVVYHHIKSEHNFGVLLERIGYELVDLIYARRLDGSSGSNHGSSGSNRRRNLRGGSGQ